MPAEATQVTGGDDPRERGQQENTSFFKRAGGTRRRPVEPSMSACPGMLISEKLKCAL